MNPARNPDATRTCEHCQQKFRRRVGSESEAKFGRRRTCSRQCSALLRAHRPEAVKTCAQCGAGFTRRLGLETTAKFAERATCSTPCANDYRGALRSAALQDGPLPEVKTCACCGEEFRRPDGESPARWVVRKFCGASCFVKAKQDGASARRAAPRSSRKPRPAAAPAVGPQTVWRPAAWGGPITIPAPAPASAPQETASAAV